jgi:biotin carboxyl carrier protein
MDKYFIHMNRSKDAEEVDIKGNEAIFKDGKVSEFGYKFLTDELILLRVDNRNYIVKGETLRDSEIKNTEFVLEYNSKNYEAVCKNELELLTEKFAQQRGGIKIKNELLSPMPGAIVKINAKEGQEVKKGEVLIVLEAMKMENELKAVANCKVQKIFVEEKASVDKDQLLIKFEI